MNAEALPPSHTHGLRDPYPRSCLRQSWIGDARCILYSVAAPNNSANDQQPMTDTPHRSDMHT